MRPLQFRSALACALMAITGFIALAGPAQAAVAPGAKQAAQDPVALLASDALGALGALRAATTPNQIALTRVGREPGAVVADRALATYTQALVVLAEAVSPRAASTVPSTLAATWESTSDARMIVVLSAIAQVGTPYRYAAASPGAFDCSGLVQWAWSQVGVALPRSAWSQIRASAARKASELKAGDLVYHYDHVSMYLGAGNAVINAPRSGKLVEVRDWGRETKFASPVS